MATEELGVAGLGVFLGGLLKMDHVIKGVQGNLEMLHICPMPKLRWTSQSGSCTTLLSVVSKTEET